MKAFKDMNLAELADFVDAELIHIHYRKRDDDLFVAKRLRELHEQTRWIPVSERMPERDAHVLVWGFRCNELYDDDTESSVGSVMWGSIDHSPCPGACYYGVWYKDITHWQRITPPEGV